MAKSRSRPKSRGELKQKLDSDPLRDYHSSRFNYWGEIFVQNLPLWRLWTARMMLTSDPIVNFALNIRNAALMAAEVTVTAKRPEIQAWVQKQWDFLWGHHRSKMVSAKKWGFAPLQLLGRNDKHGKWNITDVRDFAPEDARGLQQHNKLVGLRVKGVPLYFPQGMWLSFGAEFGSAYGTAITRRQYPPWYEKWMERGAKRLQQLRMIKDAYIGDIFWYPPDILIELPDGTKMPWKDVMREIGENRLSGGAICMPIKLDQNGKELTRYTPPQSVPGISDIFNWVESCDDDILKAADIPKEVVQAADTGSGFSGRSIPFLVLLAVCQEEFNNIVMQTDLHALRYLAWLNWGGDPEYKIEPRRLVETFSGDVSGTPMAGGSIGGMQPGQGPTAGVSQSGPVVGSGGPSQYEEDEPHEFSCLMFRLPPDLAWEVRKLSDMIDSDDLTGKGRELDPHVTIKYGLHTDDPQEVRQVVATLSPVAVQIGACSFFSGDEHDVIKLEVLSDGLHALNKDVCEKLEHTDTFPTYQPHVTLAYVKPGNGAYYAKRLDTLRGRVAAFDTLVFSDKQRVHTKIRLIGDAQFSEGDVKEQHRETIHDPKKITRVSKSLTNNQGEALFAWHHGESNSIKHAERSGEDHHHLAKHFNGALDKIAKHLGHHTTPVFTGLRNLKPEHRKLLTTPGHVFKTTASMSASTKLHKAAEFAKGKSHNLILKVHPKTGVHISNVLAHETALSHGDEEAARDEHEVILRKHSHYRVGRVHGNMIHVHEIDPDEHHGKVHQFSEGDELETRGKDLIHGGKGDRIKDLTKFDKDELKKGVKVEMEHTDDPSVALEIATDHLTEDPEYYTKLATLQLSEDESLQFDDATDYFSKLRAAIAKRLGLERAKTRAQATIAKIRESASSTLQGLADLVESQVKLLAPLLGIDLTADSLPDAIRGVLEVFSRLPTPLGISEPVAPPVVRAPVATTLYGGAVTTPPGEPETVPQEQFLSPDLRAAIQRIDAMPAASGHDWLETSSLVRQGAFAVTGELTDHAVADVRDGLSRALEEGRSQEEFKEAVVEKLGSGKLSDAHLDNVFRTNALAAYSDGKFHAIQQPLVADAFPYAMVFATRDARTRPNHAKLMSLGLDGTNVYRVDDPTFEKFRPPWDYQCRCRWSPTSVEQAARKGVKEAQEWLVRAKQLAKELGGSFYQYLEQTAPVTGTHVTPPSFEPSPGFIRE